MKRTTLLAAAVISCALMVTPLAAQSSISEPASAIDGVPVLEGPAVIDYRDPMFGAPPPMNNSRYEIQIGEPVGGSPTDRSAGEKGCAFEFRFEGLDHVPENPVLGRMIERAYDPLTCRRLIEIGEVPFESVFTGEQGPTPTRENINSPAVSSSSLQSGPTTRNAFTWSRMNEPAKGVDDLFGGGRVKTTSENFTYVGWDPVPGCTLGGSSWWHHEGRDWLVARYPITNELFTRWTLVSWTPDRGASCGSIWSKAHLKVFNDHFDLCPLGTGHTVHHWPTYIEVRGELVNQGWSNNTKSGPCSVMLYEEVVYTPAPYLGGPLLPPNAPGN